MPSLLSYAIRHLPRSLFFFFNDTATTEIYTLSLHDALPIWLRSTMCVPPCDAGVKPIPPRPRSEEHTSELQSQSNLVCRLLLEKKKKSRPLLRLTTPTPHRTGLTCIAHANSTVLMRVMR